MSSKELLRAEVCVRVVAGDFTISEAASRLGLSYRHTKRLVRRYRKRGAAGLVHQALGRRSNRARSLLEVRTRALDIIRSDYSGPPDKRFGPTLAAEHLESDHGLTVNPETLRLWMIGDGLWSRVRKRKPCRQRRERCAHFGELLQADGSFHDWLEDRGPKGWLITFIDDSTSESLAQFADAESIESVSEVFEAWIVAHGIPRGLYVDGGGAFGALGAKRGRTFPGDRPKQSQFERMCEELGVQLIRARSPQAKGRVERCHGTHQDRLVKKLRVARINNYRDANEFLKDYLAEHNRRFAVSSREKNDFHLPLSESIELSRVFSIHSQRRVSLDSVVSYKGRRLQLRRSSRALGGQLVSVEESRNGVIRIFISGVELPWAEVTPTITTDKSQPENVAVKYVHDRPIKRRPADNHPWRQPGYRREAAEAMRKLRAAAICTSPNEINAFEIKP